MTGEGSSGSEGRFGVATWQGEPSRSAVRGPLALPGDGGASRALKVALSGNRGLKRRKASSGASSRIVHYTGIKIDGKVFRVGDVVNLKSSDSDDPFISRIEGLFEQDGRKKMLVRWFYRAADIHGGEDGVVSISQTIESRPNEIFWTSHYDINDVSSLISVVTPHVTWGALNTSWIAPGRAAPLDPDKAWYVCRYMYNVRIGGYRSLPPRFCQSVSPSEIRSVQESSGEAKATAAPSTKAHATPASKRRKTTTTTSVGRALSPSSRQFLSPRKVGSIAQAKQDWYRPPRVGDAYQVCAKDIPEAHEKCAAPSPEELRQPAALVGAEIGEKAVHWSPVGRDVALDTKGVAALRNLHSLAPGDFCLINMSTPSLDTYEKNVTITKDNRFDCANSDMCAHHQRLFRAQKKNDEGGDAGSGAIGLRQEKMLEHFDGLVAPAADDGGASNPFCITWEWVKKRVARREYSTMTAFASDVRHVIDLALQSADGAFAQSARDCGKEFESLLRDAIKDLTKGEIAAERNSSCPRQDCVTCSKIVSPMLAQVTGFVGRDTLRARLCFVSEAAECLFPMECVIPLFSREEALKFIYKNGGAIPTASSVILNDPLSHALKAWKIHNHNKFLAAYNKFPKQFRKIAKHMNQTPREVVAYYYIIKRKQINHSFDWQTHN